MNLISSVTREWGIGIEGRLLARIPDDMKRFRAMTSGKAVVMGRGTFVSLPGPAPLKGRDNFILTSDKSFKADGATVCNTVGELLKKIGAYADDDVYIIGGQSLFSQLLPYCRYAYITKIDISARADRFFPNLDEMESWEPAEVSPEQTYEGISYKYVTYRNKAIK